jgi:TPR repeat protein
MEKRRCVKEAVFRSFDNEPLIIYVCALLMRIVVVLILSLLMFGCQHLKPPNLPMQDWKNLPLENVQAAAEQGNAAAEAELGFRDSARREYGESVKWFRKAAEQGNADGENDLAWMYQSGYGVEKNYDEALNWYRKAAKKGNATAEWKLGFMYENGLGGIEKDITEAVAWHRKASAKGNSKAQQALKRLNFAP